MEISINIIFFILIIICIFLIVQSLMMCIILFARTYIADIIKWNNSVKCSKCSEWIEEEATICKYCRTEKEI